MKAINKYIIIKTIEQEVKTSSGLLLSAHDVQEFRYKKGEVIMPSTHVDEFLIYHRYDMFGLMGELIKSTLGTMALAPHMNPFIF